jgi:hypothetical protein
MARTPDTTLRQISKLSGVSYKTVKLAFDSPSAPARTRPIEELVDWVRTCSPGTVELPPDLTERMILLKYETAKERKERERETKEKLALGNAEKRGRLVDRTEVQAQGAAIGMLFSSEMARLARDLPALLVGQPEARIARITQEQCDKTISRIREALSK